MSEKPQKKCGVLPPAKIVLSIIILSGAIYLYTNYKNSPQIAATAMIIAAGLISFIIFKVLRLLLKVIMFLCILAIVLVIMSTHLRAKDSNFKMNQAITQKSAIFLQNIKEGIKRGILPEST